MTYKLSLHSHLPNFEKPTKKLVSDFLDILFKKSPTLVLGITNTNNSNRYKNFLKSTNLLDNKYKINSQFKDYFFSIEKNKKKIYFIKTDEIGTEKGHILVVGFNGKINLKNLKKTLIDARIQNCIVIANHPLHDFHIPHFILKKLFGAERKISMTKQTMKNYKDLFDAVELNSYFPEDWKDIKKFARKNKLSLVSDSDAHFTNELLTSYYITKRLSFSSPEKFKRSLRKAIKKGVKLHAKSFGFEAEYKHGLQIFLHRLGIKI